MAVPSGEQNSPVIGEAAMVPEGSSLGRRREQLGQLHAVQELGVKVCRLSGRLVHNRRLNRLLRDGQAPNLQDRDNPSESGA